jgi:hypothetical protein
VAPPAINVSVLVFVHRLQSATRSVASDMSPVRIAIFDRYVSLPTDGVRPVATAPALRTPCA